MTMTRSARSHWTTHQPRPKGLRPLVDGIAHGQAVLSDASTGSELLLEEMDE
jgi:hypothetical protein